MPAITQLLLLLAICSIQNVSREKTSSDAEVTFSKWSYPIILAGGIGLFGGGFWTAAQPDGQLRMLMTRADYAKLPSQREQLYQQAALVDPWAAEPWERLAEISFGKWRTAGADDTDFESAIAAQQAAIERNPHSFHTHRTLGMFYSEHAAKSENLKEHLLAVREMEQAVRLYPHNAELQADAAKVFLAAGEATRAATAAGLAVEQDQINHSAGHTDKWLTDKVRQQMEKLGSGREVQR